MLSGIRLPKKRGLMIAFILCIAFIMLFYSLWLFQQNTIYKGVRVEGLDISGLTREEAQERLIREIPIVYPINPISLTLNDQRWTLQLEDISYRFLSGETVEKAYKIGREGNAFQRLFTILGLRLHARDVPMEVSYDESTLRKALLYIKSQVDIAGKNAAIIYSSGEIKIIKEQIGRELNIDRNLEMIKKKIKGKKNFDLSVIMDENYPKILYNSIEVINSVLSEFSTKFNPRDVNRTQNIKLACEKINGFILRSGEIFSISNVLGPRTAENGYLDAPVIFKNELVKGLGGGVCQVTTTLYDAVLLSKLEVIERSNHSMPLGYVEPGQDATLAENYIDFKFQNNREDPVCVSAEVHDDTVTVRILGKKERDSYIVRLRSDILQSILPEGEDITIDNSVPVGEKRIVRKAVSGLKVRLYRETYDVTGNLVESEKISEDVYMPVKPQIRINEKSLGNG